MIQQSQPKSKPFQRRHNVRRSGPPVSQSSAAPGSIRQASATAEIWARSGKAFCVLSSHACHVERETFASAAAFRWLRFASLRQCLSLLLIVCRQSHTSVKPNNCLSHRNVQHLQAKIIAQFVADTAQPGFLAFLPSFRAQSATVYSPLICR